MMTDLFSLTDFDGHSESFQGVFFSTFVPALLKKNCTSAYNMQHFCHFVWMPIHICCLVGDHAAQTG